MADRSTTEILTQIRLASAAREVAALSGNTGDLFVSPHETVVPIERLLAEHAQANEATLVSWSPANGVNQITVPGSPAARFCGPGANVGGVEALQALLAELDRTEERIYLFLDYVESLLPVAQEPLNAAIEVLARAAVDSSLWRKRHQLIICFRTRPAHEMLLDQPAFRDIEVPLPNLAEREALLRIISERDTTGIEFDPGELAEATTGLTARQIRARIGELAELQLPICGAEFVAVKHRAISANCGDALNPIAPGRPIDQLPGLHAIKRVVTQSVETGVTVPHLLLCGPPGTGKSFVVASIAETLGWTAVGWGEVMSPWVGESERRLRGLINTVEQLAPVVVHIDEVDQVIGRSPSHGMQQGDGGVSERLRGRLLEWLSDVQRRADIVVVATSNRPDRLGDEFGNRFMVIPVLHPDVRSAAGIVSVTAEAMGRSVSQPEVHEFLSTLERPLTGRLLVRVLNEAARRDPRRRNDARISTDTIRSVFDDLLDSGRYDGEIEMALRALRLTEFTTNLPWVAARELNDPIQPPRYLQGIATTTGIDSVALETALRELRHSELL